MPAARPEVTRGALRGVRAIVVATAALVLAATAHLAGGGAMPSAPLLALMVVPLAWGAVVITGRELGRWSLIVALGGTQLLLHEAFMVLSAPACPAAVSGMPGMPDSATVEAGLSSCPATVQVMAPMHSAGTPSGSSGLLGHGVLMPVAHVAATVATAFLLVYGDRLLAAFLGMLAGLMNAGFGLLLGPLDSGQARARLAARVRRAWSWSPPRLPALTALTGAQARRGPPVLGRAVLTA